MSRLLVVFWVKFDRVMAWFGKDAREIRRIARGCGPLEMRISTPRPVFIGVLCSSSLISDEMPSFSQTIIGS